MLIDPPLDVFIPNLEARDPMTASIDAGSGIVGSNAEEWLAAKHGEPVVAASGTALTIDYEGNRYGAINIVTWADRVSHAADRHRTHYPSSARHIAEPDALIRVGTFDGERVHLDCDHDARLKLADWLGLRFEGDRSLAHEVATSSDMTRVP